ncbi:DUF7504 family protein [Natrarchaeobaculum sulfurireducens]|uniref:KaiC-like protein ATPase n=1 Tax=Natrarchaeobaculum sulfurireducens TaxID=2044521 RepID=A0A346PM99_9EURY|nr:hypothetical protein [Natrarchaeobaculum sulfurireducens]AXR79280.1 KaiC-like protein ATPase [Natrarchaeobaculum sulfurireducens]AXR80644.1 hypothetical protein AArcMg_0621 [Natrarchaeobaculum sulfurireducens]
MSLRTQAFSLDPLPLEDIDSGTSILLTGDDEAALKSIFARIVAADEDEKSIVLATNSGGPTVRRTLEAVKQSAGSRSFVLSCQGPDQGEEIKTVDELGDLTNLGMHYSGLVAAAQQSTTRFRSGIFLCSTILGEVDDTRSVYRFLNSNLLTDLRRGEGIGVCAIDTSADIGTDVDSMLSGMEVSFTGRIDVKTTGQNEATLETSGLSSTDETVTVSL